MKSTIQSLDVSLLLHATEDSERVIAAVRGLIEGDWTLETEEVEGHFGNRIKKVGVHLHGDQATKAFGALTARMPEGLRREFARDIGKLVDEHSSLFLRFDKQRLVEGEIASGYEDAVRLKVKPRAFLMHGHARDFFLKQLQAG